MTTTQRPPGRYDEPRPIPRWLVATLAGVLGVLLLGLTYASWDRFSTARTKVVVLGYSVVDDTHVEVRFEVHKKAAATVTCAVRARGADLAVVGREDVVVGPADTTPVVVTHRLSTTTRAASGEVVSCST